MRSKTPKVLHEVGGVPMLAHPLRALAAVGASSAVVVTGHEAERVEEKTAKECAGLIDVIFARQDPPLGTGDAVEKAFDAIPERTGTALILNGDLPLLRPETLEGLLAEHRARGSAMTVLSLHRDDPSGYGRLIEGPDRAIERIIEQKDASPEDLRVQTVNGGLYAVELDALRPVLAAWCAAESARIAAGEPGPSEIYFPPVVGPLAETGARVGHSPLAESAFDDLQQVNDRRELSIAEALLRDRIITAHQLAGVTITDPTQTWIECDVTIGGDTTVFPGCVIRRGVEIGAECEVGPHAHLREGTVLEDDVKIGNYVEVKKTRIGSGARAKHLTYLGNGEIGRKVNVGAGTVLANYDGKNKFTTVVGEGAFIGSGTIIVAPAEIGDGAVTGAGALVTRNTTVSPGETVLGVPARPIPSREPDSPSR